MVEKKIRRADRNRLPAVCSKGTAFAVYEPIHGHLELVWTIWLVAHGCVGGAGSRCLHWRSLCVSFYRSINDAFGKNNVCLANVSGGGSNYNYENEVSMAVGTGFLHCF